MSRYKHIGAIAINQVAHLTMTITSQLTTGVPGMRTKLASLIHQLPEDELTLIAALLALLTEIHDLPIPPEDQNRLARAVMQLMQLASA